MTYQEFKTKYQIRLNPQQESAVQAVDGYVLLLAVPGSGKTTVLITRLGYMLLGRGIEPSHILTTTYTVAATRDMRARFERMFGTELAKKLEFRTINGVSARVIRRYEQLYHTRAFDLCNDEKEISSLIREIYHTLCRDFPTESDIKGIRSQITYVKNQMLSEQEIEENTGGIDHFPEIYRAYNQNLLNHHLMDYDDQMVYALKILQKYPDICCEFQRRYTHICVDEAQDTSKIQHRIIALLAEGAGNLFMVGDEDQSIYGFRAAYPQALMEFEQVHSGARVLLMERNYRSTREIVGAADRFVQKNKDRHPKHMVPMRGSGRAVRCIPVRDRKSQYAYLLRMARDCRQDTAVLYRDNDIALPMIDLLERHKIPYSCRQMDSTFFSNRIVQDITDVICLARNQSDGETFLRIYYKFCAGITKAAAESAARYCNAETTVFALLMKDGNLSQWARSQCKGLKTHLTNLLNERADKAIYRIVHFMGYGQYLEEHGADTSRIDILQTLGEQTATPEGLLERLTQLRDIVQSPRKQENALFTLSTIHSSKGLEYGRVFLMDVVDGIFPKLDDKDKIPEEERRLFYVGMTRAKEELAVFTFQKSDMVSTFGQELFPTKKPLEKACQPIPKPGVKKALSEEMLGMLVGCCVPGQWVEHTKFGSGIIVGATDDIVSIRFTSGQIRRFMLREALRMGALKVIRK